MAYGIPNIGKPLNTLKSGIQGIAANVAKGFTPPANITDNSFQNTDPGVSAAMGKIAGYGQQYKGATPEMQTQLHNQAMSAGQAVGGVYNPRTGQWDFSNAKSEKPVTIAGTGGVTPPQAPQGSYPGQLTTDQIQREAAARIAKLRAGVENAVTAGKAARKNAFDYTNQITGDNRTLQDARFHENHISRGGGTDYQRAMLDRDRSIQDTANNNNYQADINALDNQLTSFDMLAPEQQQALYDQLTRQERDYGLQEGALTGQFNGSPTLAALGQQAQYTGVYGGQPTIQAQNQNFQQNLVTNQNNFNQNMQTKQFDAQQAAQQWDQAFQNKQFDNQVAAQIWDQHFKDKSFQQGVNEFAANLGLNYDQLDQSQKQFVADQAFKERTFKEEQEQNIINGLYKNRELTLSENAANQPAPISNSQANNNSSAEYVTALDALTPDERKTALSSEKAEMIKELGVSGYNAIYNMYFDSNGNPK